MPDDPYSLDRLKDIVQPEAVSWWPPAPFWYCLVVIGGVWLLYAIAVAVCRRLKNAYRRQALRELAAITEPTAIAADTSSSNSRANSRRAPSAQEVSTILKRVALVSFPREQVASLSGDAWLQFLSSTCDRVDFTKTPTRCIGSASFTPTEGTPDSDLTQIIHDAKTWIVDHQAEAAR